MKTDLPAVRDRPLADFPHVIEVLAMTTPATVLVAYTRDAEVDAWLTALSETVAMRRMSLGGDRVPRRHAANGWHAALR